MDETSTSLVIEPRDRQDPRILNAAPDEHTRQNTSLALLVATPPDRHPAAVYLARLASGSRRTMGGALDVVAGLLTSYRCDKATLDWGALRYQHTAAVRAHLADLYAPVQYGNKGCVSLACGRLVMTACLEQEAHLT